MIRHRGLATTVRTVAVAVLFATATLALGASGVAVATPLLLASPNSRRRDFLLLLGWILVGAFAGGAIGWGLAQAVAPTAGTISVIFGAAIGGGFAAVIRLFVFGNSCQQEPESVTIDAGDGDDERVPDPEPVDLFEGNPDPILYFDDAGDGPVVRAANPAYEAVFGVNATAVENAALGDALMVTDRTERVVDAAAAGEQFDDVIACETGQETVRFRVRTTTDGLAGTRGYVLYTPVEPDG